MSSQVPTGDLPLVSISEAVSLISGFPALAGADFEVRPGEIVLLRGPNGAGKTTLLRLCAGLAGLDRGRGRVLGHDLSRRGDRLKVRRAVAYLGHNGALYGDLTVAENLRFWARANRVPEVEMAPVVRHLGLDGRLAGIPVSGLSAGQRRRVALAVVVGRRSPLWLLDEPHTGFDAGGRDLLDDLIRRAGEAGAGVVLSSHELDRATGLADRVVSVVGGRTQDPTASGETAAGGSPDAA